MALKFLHAGYCIECCRYFSGAICSSCRSPSRHKSLPGPTKTKSDKWITPAHAKSVFIGKLDVDDYRVNKKIKIADPAPVEFDIASLDSTSIGSVTPSPSKPDSKPSSSSESVTNRMSAPLTTTFTLAEYLFCGSRRGLAANCC